MMHFALCLTQCRARVDNGSLRPRLVLLVMMHHGFVPLGCPRPKIFCILVDTDQKDSCAHGILLATQKGTHSANCAGAVPVEMAPVQFLGHFDSDSAENRGGAAVAVPTVVVDVAASCSDKFQLFSRREQWKGLRF